MLAGALKSPLLEIDSGEADKLAAALDGVLSHYVNIDVDPRTRDWINLAVVSGGIYGPRVFAAMQTKKKAAPAPEAVKPTELKAPAEAITRKVHVPGVGEVEVPVQ